MLTEDFEFKDWSHDDGMSDDPPGMITEFELQKGDGISVEIVGKEAEELWLIIDEDTLVKMIQIAFDAPGFTLAELIDALRYNQRVITKRSEWPGE